MGAAVAARTRRPRRVARARNLRCRPRHESARTETAAFRREGQVGDFPDDGRRPESDGDLRSETAPQQTGGGENARELRQDSRAVHRRHAATAARLQDPVPRMRRVADSHLGRVSVAPAARRPARRHPQLPPRRLQPLAGAIRPHHRHDAARFPEHRGVDHLWPRLGRRQSPGHGRDDRSRRENQRRHAVLGQRLPPRRLSRFTRAGHGRTHSLRQPPAG